MIRLACTNCKTILLIDDAFAGGVCRCQHCGTIQTVPAPTKATPGATVSGRAMGGVKVQVLVDRDRDRGNMPLSGTGLDELAGIVHSSGIAGSGLTSRRLTRPDTKPAAATSKERRASFWVLLGVAAAAVVGAGVLLTSRMLQPQRGSRPAGETVPSAGVVVTDPTSTDAPPAARPVVGANFCGTALVGSSVVYLIDRGSGTKEIFPALEDAALRSVGSLGAGKRFQILFWANGSESAGYPLGSTTYATAENLEAARRAIDSVGVFGASEVNSVFPTALASEPDRIVLVTPKGWSLDTAWADDLLKLRGSSPVSIDTFSLGGGGAGTGLQRLASQTGGSFTAVSDAQLRAAGGG